MACRHARRRTTHTWSNARDTLDVPCARLPSTAGMLSCFTLGLRSLRCYADTTDRSQEHARAVHRKHTRPILLRVRTVLGPTNFRRNAATAAVSSAAAASFGDLADSSWVPGGLEDTGDMRALSRPIRELIGFVMASVKRRSQVSFTRSAAKPLLAASPVDSLCCRGKLFSSGWQPVPGAAGPCARRKQTYVPQFYVSILNIRGFCMALYR